MNERPQDQDTSLTSQQDHDARLERLSRHATQTRSYNPAYSKLVRWMRLILPVIALIIVAMLFVWPSLQKQDIPTISMDKESTLVGRKELINPVFESIDKKNQPYKIIATRALQGESDENLILLEEPNGHIQMDNDESLDVSSKGGSYRQDTQRLFLEGNVKMIYNSDHTLETDKLDIDMKESQAWSKTDIKAYGSMGNLEAKGLEARNEEGILIFTGPAKLTLTKSLEGL